MSEDSSRAFQEVEVDNFRRQDCVDRFGFSWPLRHPNDPFNGVTQKIRDLWPAPWRLSLTALSHKYNLYFAAIQEKIHIIRPRGLSQTLPGDPDLIIHLPRSQGGYAVGGYISHTKPHCVNHLVVGNLGNYEIVLLVCDDGDVLAYYTTQLNRELLARQNESPRPPPSQTQPMFHENVGMSAWGLAIHQKTRLIAVSSNLREVSVFVFGQRWSEDSKHFEEKIDPSDEKFPPSAVGLNKKDLITHELRYNNRKVLKLPPNGHNIPCIDFVDDLEGHASQVVATDILGNLWLLNIWKTKDHGPEENCVERLIASCHPFPRGEGQPMGWAVMAIPVRNFRYCETSESTFGTSPEDDLFTTPDNPREAGNAPNCHYDISSTIHSIADTSTWHPSFAGLRLKEARPKVPTERHLEFAQRYWQYYQQTGNCPIPLLNGAPEPKTYFDFLLALIPPLANCIHPGRLAIMDTTPDIPVHALINTLKPYFLESLDIAKIRDSWPDPLLSDGSAILRTFTDDVELIPPLPCDESLHTVCNKILTQKLPQLQNGAIPVTFAHMQRLTILLRVDDLGIVIVGSQAGRVALLGLTRMKRREGSTPLVGFRVERILPKMKEEDEGYRSLWGTLIGVAVGPLQGAEVVDEEDEEEGQELREFEDQKQKRRHGLGDGEPDPDLEGQERFLRWLEREKKDRKISRRWRLFLHYSDHSVLNWELWRDEVSSELVIF